MQSFLLRFRGVYGAAWAFLGAGGKLDAGAHVLVPVEFHPHNRRLLLRHLSCERPAVLECRL